MSATPPGQPEGSPQGQAEDRHEAIATLMTALLVTVAANALIPFLFDLDAMSDRSHSMRLIVSVAGILFAVLGLALEWGRIQTSLLVKCTAIIVLSAAALSSVRWTSLGWGTVGLLGLFAVPTVVKLAQRGR